MFLPFTDSYHLRTPLDAINPEVKKQTFYIVRLTLISLKKLKRVAEKAKEIADVNECKL